ncbi:putative oxidoreductase [Anopheles sinensis]|uniref:Putative oxidoreductase n=1 Tax=Anopheles sinensis TaxID=74873 RepID=A0A084VGS3_ANOSI|nr:putative oxidoreductase [Anopheles sinensis]
MINDAEGSKSEPPFTWASKDKRSKLNQNGDNGQMNSCLLNRGPSNKPPPPAPIRWSGKFTRRGCAKSTSGSRRRSPIDRSPATKKMPTADGFGFGFENRSQTVANVFSGCQRPNHLPPRLSIQLWARCGEMDTNRGPSKNRSSRQTARLQERYSV